MDRPLTFGSVRVLGGLALALLVLLSAGCRSTRSEVPAARPYARTGDQPPTVGFSSQPHPAAGQLTLGSANLGAGGAMDDPLAAAASASIYGTPTAGDKLAMPTSNLYGRPGTSGLDLTAGAGTSDLGDALMQSGDSVADSLKRDPNIQQAAETPR